MSQYESGYATALRAARDGESADYADDLARLVGNISTRTKNLRDNFSDAVSVMLDAAPKALTNAKHLRTIRNRTRKLVLKHLRENYPTLSPQTRKQFELRLDKELKSDDLSSFVERNAKELVSNYDVPKMATAAHNQALGKTLANTQRIEFLKTLSWGVNLQPEPTWILGDVGCIAKAYKSEELRNVVTPDVQDIEAICLPISDRALLIGRDAKSQFQPNPEQVNRASAELSLHFFVSSVITDRQRALQSLIGARGSLMSDEELRKIMEG
jgi:hypothetical protein